MAIMILRLNGYNQSSVNSNFNKKCFLFVFTSEAVLFFGVEFLVTFNL